MTQTATEVITDQDVRAILEERTQEMYQFRQAYRDHDATGVNSGKFTFPKATDDLRDEVVEVVEDSDYPRTELNYGGVDASYSKDGVELAVSDEAVADSAIDIIADALQEMAVAMQKKNDMEAFTGLTNNVNTTIGTDGTDLDYPTVVEAYTTLVEAEYNPNEFLLLLSPDAWGDLSTDDRFVHATEAGDETVRGAVMGSIYGMDAVLTNTGDLGDDEAFIVDTSKFGYESTRWNQEVTTYREDRKDRDVYKIRDRRAYAVMDDNANVFLQGGGA